MKNISEIRSNKRIRIIDSGGDGGCGYIYFPPMQRKAVVVFSWGDGWDHISVSYADCCLSWDEMCQVKDMFFKDDECVIQYHPAKADYINQHLYVLHLWRPQNEIIPMPPKYMV